VARVRVARQPEQHGHRRDQHHDGGIQPPVQRMRVPVRGRMARQQHRAERPAEIPDHAAGQQPEVRVQLRPHQNMGQALARMPLPHEPGQPHPRPAHAERRKPAGKPDRGAQALHRSGSIQPGGCATPEARAEIT